MDRIAVKINVRDAHGREDAVPLDATIDQTIRENIILQQVFTRLKLLLALESTPIEAKTIKDSYGARYTTSDTVTLLIGQTGQPWSVETVFHISESQDAAPGAGNRILLGNIIKARFSLPRADGRESVDAAPTVLCYKDSQDKKQRREDAAKKQADVRKAAKENEKKLNTKIQERKDRDNNGQSTSAA
ncbi:hypothetical protein BJX64DRAFT_266297 [Aspergillus heterothallicus]